MEKLEQELIMACKEMDSPRNHMTKPEVLINPKVSSAGMQTDVSEETKLKKPKLQIPSANDTLLATYTAPKLSCKEILRDLTSGDVVFFTAEDIIIKNSEHTYRVYSAWDTEKVQYIAHKDLLETQVIKLKKTSKISINTTLTQLKNDQGSVYSLCLFCHKTDPTPVTTEDIIGNKCWFYIVVNRAQLKTDAGDKKTQFKTDPIVIKYIKANKKQVRMYYGKGKKVPLMGGAAILKLNDAGVAVRRKDCKGHVEMTFPTKSNRYQSYWVKEKDLPADMTVPCHIIKENNSIYISIPSSSVEGRFNTIVGVRKKFARARGSSNDIDYDTDEECPPIKKIKLVKKETVYASENQPTDVIPKEEIEYISIVQPSEVTSTDQTITQKEVMTKREGALKRKLDGEKVEETKKTDISHKILNPKKPTEKAKTTKKYISVDLFGNLSDDSD